mgnify:CR=1 FL=1
MHKCLNVCIHFVQLMLSLCSKSDRYHSLSVVELVQQREIERLQSDRKNLSLIFVLLSAVLSTALSALSSQRTFDAFKFDNFSQTLEVITTTMEVERRGEKIKLL